MSANATNVTRVEHAVTRAVERVTRQALGPYQTAVVRIGFALTWLLFLLREFPHRHELYGPDSPWSRGLAEQLLQLNDAFTVLMWSDSDAFFEIVYGLAVLASLALMLGWRTRTMSVLFMIGVLSLQNRSVFMGDGGDNVIHLVAIYLVLTRCGQVWSLDARRRARTAPDAPPRDAVGVWLWSVLGFGLLAATLLGHLSWGWALIFYGLWLAQAVWWMVQRLWPGEPRTVCDQLANLVHNAGLLIIMVQVVFVYATAGWYKVQGTLWQDGTALHYPLHLDYFTPWPALSDTLGGSGTMVMIITYGTVIVQVAFPFTLFNRRIKNVLLALMIIEHASIAVILGLPFFSLAMIAADAVFLPTVFLMWIGGWTVAGRDRLIGRRRRAAEPAALKAPRQSAPADVESGTPLR
ncbi:HTTM domain-containing protein [Streptomyces coryli]|uniref:HTTM domain-containing protein n=1 Tax=Streptomyces coryli TaxID=1128680 RepID=UPI0030B89581